MMKMYEEERRRMILNQLQILTTKKISENADVDHSIQLLQVGQIIERIRPKLLTFRSSWRRCQVINSLSQIPASNLLISMRRIS